VSPIAPRAGKPASPATSQYVPIAPLLVISTLGIALSLGQALISPKVDLVDAETAFARAVPAESLRPIEIRNLELGAVAGIAFYTVEQDGYRLVVSLQVLETGMPLRFVATLAPEQRVTLSAPRRPGEPWLDVNFIRHGEGIDVNASTAPRFEAYGD
jgi:hypothetical protein